MVCLGCFFFHLNPLLSPHHREERQSLSCCVFVIHGWDTFFTQPDLGILVKQSWAISLRLINIIYFARQLGQIIAVCNQSLSAPHNGESFSGSWVAQKVGSWSWGRSSPPAGSGAGGALSPSQPWQPQTGLPEGATAGHHCSGDTSQLLLGGKSLQDASKIKTVHEAEPPTLSPCSSPPLSDESLFRLVFLASINPNSNYSFPYLFSPALAALLEAECIFSMGSQSRGCIPGLWYTERHGTPANKGPNSLYIPMVLWMACPAQSLQRCQTARRIGVYVSFQSFTNTLLICGLSWPLRELTSYKMEWFFFFFFIKNRCILWVLLSVYS